MEYKYAFLESLTNKELVSSYDKLTGSSLYECLKSIKTGGLNLEIDKATGRLRDELQKFNSFFDEFIWSRLPKEAFVQPAKN